MWIFHNIARSALKAGSENVDHATKNLPWETLVSAHLANNEPGGRAHGFEICCAHDTDL